jgi:hypothetical protein
MSINELKKDSAMGVRTCNIDATNLTVICSSEQANQSVINNNSEFDNVKNATLIHDNMDYIQLNNNNHSRYRIYNYYDLLFLMCKKLYYLCVFIIYY